jgi:hypothetical protein
MHWVRLLISKQFHDAQTPISERQALLEKLKATYPDYTWLAFVAPDGIV